MQANTEIHIIFADGQSREFTVTDQVEQKISEGKVFIIEAIHPEYGEKAIVRIGTEIPVETLMKVQKILQDQPVPQDTIKQW